MLRNKLTKNSIFTGLLLLLLLAVSLGNPIVQLFGIVLFSSISLLFLAKSTIIDFKALFYLTILIITFFQFLFVWRDDYSINYLMNTGIICVMWILMLLVSLSIAALFKKISLEKIHVVLKLFFSLNVLIVIVQYVNIAIQKKSIFPHMVSMGAGDFIKGVFTNSSVSMIIFSFYTVYFFYRKENKLCVAAILCMLASTYMSGIVIFSAIVFLFAFLYFSPMLKLKILIGLSVGIFVLALISPKNIEYVKQNLTEKLVSKSDPLRKIVSFNQTVKYFGSDLKRALFGAGGGKFSSRTAFLTSADYVSWFPEKYKYMSKEFTENHYTLWNSELLKQPYKDGTANQPFSFYNKIFGEYGVVGALLFVVLYLGKWIKNFNKLTFGKLIFMLMLSFFVLDYWFEYFTVIAFFELFMALDLKTKRNGHTGEKA
ncbi:hypothetical protein [Maribacter thermophilus]|uniref:hypothetical protein n=1 Tax=Maribacter thermophilus TaxID=1197874 RepID=UPI000640C236|nr:hypothetical protein [Maribacter thermophilus]